MRGTVAVRPATVTDADAMGRVHVAGWRAAYDGIVPADFLAALDEHVSARRRRTIIESPADGQVCLVAQREGAVIGFVVGGASRDEDAGTGTGEIYAIYIDPASWGAGAGSMLLTAAVDQLQGNGFRAATLWVLADNAPARRFYGARGWVLDGASKVVTFGAPVQEVRYRREV